MSLKVRTFLIPDEDRIAAEESVADFLGRVRVNRIETAAAPAGWRLLVMYTDPRHAEESEQIASLISANLRSWRDELATEKALSLDDIMDDDTVARIAQYVPTTVLELKVMLQRGDLHPFLKGQEEEIVHIVRETLDELS